MTRPAPRLARVRVPHVQWLRDRLGERDWAVARTVGALRLATGAQLERLHFADLPASHRSRTRRKVLKRLTEWRVLVPLERRIGGVRAGSGGLVFALDSAGQWLANLDRCAAGEQPAVRRPTQPSHPLLAHTLGVAEQYVQLREQERAGVLRLAVFVPEPVCWWPNGIGGRVKPDAYVVVSLGDVVDHYWLEHDEATESLPTIRKKLTAYLDLVRRGQRGPGGIIPRVLVRVPTEARRGAIQALVAQLPDPAHKMFRVVTHERTTTFIGEVLRE